MRLFIFILFFFTLSILFSQDTIRVMHYNLLYYGVNTGFCNWTNNNPDQKDAWLRTVVAYEKPDILTVNEISQESTYQERILNSVMNQAGYALFEMAASPNYAGSNIVNQIYFNSEKLALHSQEVAQSEVRDIDVYSLYYLNEGLLDGDTIFIHCIVGHLKAGTSSSDEQKRKIMTQNALDYLEENGRTGNYLFMGDFNVYESDEDAFQLMITNDDPVFRFNDPVDEVGDWHVNPVYRHVHTQSTHTNSGNCHAGGGMDDRFDFILMNEVLKNEGDNMYYLEDSYKALGQDGLRLDGSLLDPPNTSLPAYVLDALYNMSDHLPVVMDIVVEETMGIAMPWYTQELQVVFNNPVKDLLQLRFGAGIGGMADLSLISMAGSQVYDEQISVSASGISVSLSHLPSGMYFLRIVSSQGVYTGKVVIL
jgi:exonuclease III